MKYGIVQILIIMVLYSVGAYAQSASPSGDDTAIVSISKAIITDLKETKFSEVLKYCYPGSELAGYTEKQAAVFESKKDDPSVLEFKLSTFSYLDNAFDLGSDKGIVVCKTDKKAKKEFILWIFRKHEDKWYIHAWKSLPERGL